MNLDIEHIILIAKGFFYGIKINTREKGVLFGIGYIFKKVPTYLVPLFYIQSYVLYQRIRSKPVVHVIGDSHVSSFRGKRPFIEHWIGPATAYNLNKTQSSTRSGEKFFLIINRFSKKDIVMLVFGEIDCRYHIYKKFQENDEKVSIEQLINQTISNYGQVIKSVRDLGFITCVYNVVPPPNGPPKGVDLPYCGSTQIRAAIQRLFNQKLKEFCLLNDCLFIDINSKVSDKDGFMLEKYAGGDNMHLNSKAVPFVTQQLKEEYKIIL